MPRLSMDGCGIGPAGESTASPEPAHRSGPAQDHHVEVSRGVAPRAEAALDVACLARAFERWPHGVYAVDRQGRYIFQNAVDRAAFGDLLHKSASDVADEVALSEDWEHVHRRALAGETVTYRSRRRDASGMRETEITVSPLRQGDEIVAVLGMTVDRSQLLSTQRELEAERRRIADFVACASDWVWEQDENFVFVDAALPFTVRGRSPVGQTRWQFAGADVDTDPVWAEHLASLKRHEPIRSFVYQAATTEGRPVWIEVNGLPIHDEDGVFRGYRGTARDVTAREEMADRVEAALEAATQALAELKAYTAALDQFAMVTVTDAQTLRVTHANDLFCTITGYDRNEVIGQQLSGLIDSEVHPPEFYETMRQTLFAGEIWHGRMCNRRRDGSLYWVLETTVPQRGGDGEIVAYVSIGFEITEQVQAENQIRESEARYRLLADNSSDVIILGLADGRRTYFSPAVFKLTGYTPEEALRVSMKEWVHPEDLPTLFQTTSSLNRDNPVAHVLHRLRRKDGAYIWVEGAFSWVEREPEPIIVATIRDVTGRKKIENEYRDLYDHSVVGIYRKSLDGRLIRANPCFVAMRGFASEEELIAAHRAGKAQWRAVSAGSEQQMALLLRDGVVRDSVYAVKPQGSETLRWVSETAWLVRDDNGEPLYIEGMIVDVSERMAAQENLARQAREDALTGLCNRLSLREAADRAIEEAGDRRSEIAVVYLDLDRFKAVNDTLGHAAGDDLLQQVACRLSPLLSEGEVLARLGGDEFAALLPVGSGPLRGEQLAIQAIAAINHPFRLDTGQIVNVGASVGIANVKHGEVDAEEVLRRADLAMYQAKRDGRNAYRCYREALDEQLRIRQRMEAGLRRALTHDEFRLEFQPVFDARTRRHRGFEALLRWDCPADGPISPATFIPVAEDAGLIAPIGEWVLRNAVAEAARWPEHLRVAINVAVQQLRHSDFLMNLRHAIGKHAISPERIEIEVTESALLDDSPMTLEVLQRIQQLGVKVALDDFGTGWSSLSYLNRHRFDRIKIDRCFVQGLSDVRNDAIVSAIAQLCDRLGIAITAEGVETDEQLARIAELGCHEAQGFLLGRPMPAEAALAFCRDRTGAIALRRYVGGVR